MDNLKYGIYFQFRIAIALKENSDKIPFGVVPGNIIVSLSVDTMYSLFL
ncbi:MAG: hypothetical protein WBV73_31770 [Phormidium sp.]